MLMAKAPMGTEVLSLRRDGVALVVATPVDGVPWVAYWGADPGPLSDSDTAALVAAAVPGVPHCSVDVPRLLSLLPGPDESWQGTPGFAAHREGRAVLPRWTDVHVEPDGTAPATGIVVTASDAGLAWRAELELAAGGVLRVRHAITNTDAAMLTLDGLLAILPLPEAAAELLDLTGRWCRERSPQRARFDHGTRLRASRRGRTGHDATTLLFAGTPGFGFRSGEVWGVHAAWSGDHVHLAERLPERAGQASAVLAGGELLAPGEIRLAEGETYRTPWVVFVHSASGLDGAATRVHRMLRARPRHPATPRPVTVNIWEGVYFDHDLTRLRRLADAAADVGAERFVVDDGWFRGRRHDRAGLGDWVVDRRVWPDGLAPLFDHVRALGMTPGLWAEPEMVNLDSDLARAHPDWLLSAPGRLPAASRHQHVLDLGRPEVYEYLLTALDAVVAAERPDYLKWDHNRDLIASVDAEGRGGVRRQTTAFYRLLDELASRHPGLEIESCASGGGRIDLGVLEHTDRVWTSDCNDPLERQRLQRWSGQLLPPELLGMHVGPDPAHTTGRSSTLEFRCLTALFGHAGMELDLGRASAGELATLRRWTALHKELRPLLHAGETVRADLPDAGALLHGVVSADRREAVYAYVRLDSSPEDRPDRVRLPGLDAATRYRVEVVPEFSSLADGAAPPPWIADGLVTTGAVLALAGPAMPVLLPQHGALLRVRAV